MNTSSIVAVSHGTFLRMLLATALDMPLYQTVMMRQANGCINVLDISTTEKVTIETSKCKLFGGSLLSRLEEDFTFVLPKVTVVRINEIRHLEGLI